MFIKWKNILRGQRSFSTRYMLFNQVYRICDQGRYFESSDNTHLRVTPIQSTTDHNCLHYWMHFVFLYIDLVISTKSIFMNSETVRTQRICTYICSFSHSLEYVSILNCTATHCHTFFSKSFHTPLQSLPAPKSTSRLLTQQMIRELIRPNPPLSSGKQRQM